MQIRTNPRSCEDNSAPRPMFLWPCRSATGDFENSPSNCGSKALAKSSYYFDLKIRTALNASSTLASNAKARPRRCGWRHLARAKAVPGHAMQS
jgi:hypothetical protein